MSRAFVLRRRDWFDGNVSRAKEPSLIAEEPPPSPSPRRSRRAARRSFLPGALSKPAASREQSIRHHGLRLDAGGAEPRQPSIAACSCVREWGCMWCWALGAAASHGALAASGRAGQHPTRKWERLAQASSPSGIVVGIDEAGVGTIAGPVIAAAVCLPEDFPDDGGAHCRDSKAMSKAERQVAFDWLDATPGLVWASAVISSHRVDALGGAAPAAALAIRLAARKLQRRLVSHMRTTQQNASDISAGMGPARTAEVMEVPTPAYLVDGDSVPRGLTGGQALVRGDQLETTIAAASVVASAAHDRAMERLADRWELWDLGVNNGWPSREHLRLIVAHGPSGCHRASCFPFRVRHGRRLGHHPDRAAYAAVQTELRRARRERKQEEREEREEEAAVKKQQEKEEEGEWEEEEEGARARRRTASCSGRRGSRAHIAAADDDERDALSAARRQRYRNWVECREGKTIGVTSSSGGPPSEAGSRHAKRRRRRSR